MVKNTAMVAEGVKSLSYATICRDIESWEEKACNLEIMLVSNEAEEAVASEASKKKTEIFKRRLIALNVKIENGKKRCKVLES